MTAEELEALQQDKANLKGSYWINKIKAGETLKVSNLQGSKIDIIGERGRHISKGTKGDITAMHLTAILDGINPFIRAADMKSEYGIGFGEKNKDYSYQEAVEILSAQLEDEIRTSILLNTSGVGNNVAGYRENAADLRYFKSIVTVPANLLADKVDDVYISEYVRSESVQTQLLNHIKAQQAQIENHLKEYQFVMPAKSGYTNVGLSNTQLDNLAEITSLNFDGTHITQSLLDAYTKQIAIGHTINTIEMSKVLLGDLALFSPSSIFKRAKLAAGAKIYPNTGTEVNDWFNTNMPRKYGEHSDKLTSVVRNDIKIDAEFLNEYVKEVEKHLVKKPQKIHELLFLIWMSLMEGHLYT